ncbi:MAG TPA: HAMP domain-containing sensor histidine kinase [Micropepsaceae bacterium]|nr:HAMP domain-containing sensor histidine kinase [Micropepsaceae bacterium]
MAHALTSGRQCHADPRLLQVQVERAAKAIRASVIGSPLWVCFFAAICSNLTPFLGRVRLDRAAEVVFLVLVAAALAHLVLRSYHRSANDPDTVARWRLRLLGLSVFVSAAWGSAPWLLWDDVNNSNHVFIALMCLAIVARIVVNRSNHVTFFLASFLPMGTLLFVRFAVSFQPTDLILAALVPLYGIQVFLDSNHISTRWDEESQMRFSHEDMSRELEEARDEALRKRTEAEAANASKTSFLANMSHELRTPLNAILGFSEIIARECLGPVGSPRYKEYAGDIHTSGSHLLSLINDLLDVAKIEAGRMEIEPQMIETERALDSALKFVGPKARERNQVLTVTVDDAAALLFADERAVKQIVINLVTNSVKFTCDGGKIAVAACQNKDGDFELTVEDNGSGVPKEKLDRIFKPFSRVDNRYDSENGGTGLGLSLVRGLAELHGGRAWMDSELGRGSCVHVVLPMSSAQQRAKRRARA